LRIAGLVQDSIVDGPGFRFAVFTQGCELRCSGCHNPETWDEAGGTEIPIEEIIKEMLSNPLTDGLTLSGGEPLEQAADCAGLAAAARENGLNVWIFTGKTFEHLHEEAKTDYNIEKLLSLTDVMVDGKFVLTERTLSVKWCGSRNQRILDVPKSLAEGKAALLTES